MCPIGDSEHPFLFVCTQARRKKLCYTTQEGKKHIYIYIYIYNKAQSIEGSVTDSQINLNSIQKIFYCP